MANKAMTRDELEAWKIKFVEDFNNRQEAAMSNCTCGYAIGHPLVPKCTCKKREWKGLTREDVTKAWQFNTFPAGFDEFMRKIEAILKERNT